MQQMMQMMQMMGGGGGCGGMMMGKGGKGGKGKGGVKAGDWICPGCGDHQYARNDECRKCSTPKPTEGLVQISSNSQLKLGDWICPVLQRRREKLEASVARMS